MRLFYLLICFLLTTSLFSQGTFYFGPKAGLTLAVQQWNNLERDPLFAYNGSFFIESYDPEDRGSLFAQIGYHKRGSGIRVFDFFSSNSADRSFQFNNLALQLGAKKRFNRSDSKTFFYHVAIRGEYTLNTNLSDYEELNRNFPFYPFDQFVNKINYGLSFGGGIEFGSSKFAVPFLDITISPDISLQYRQDAIPNIVNPFTGLSTTLSERNIRNLTLEITFGMRFLREVIYIDDY